MKAMSTFTPGPWRVEGRYDVVQDKPFPCPRKIVNTISGECRDVGEPGDVGNNTDGANARLIAKSPEMYRLLKELVLGSHNQSLAAQNEVYILLKEIDGGQPIK